MKARIFDFFFKIWDTTSTGAGETPLNSGDTKAMEISALEFSHDGTKLAVIVNNCDYVHVLETESGKILTTIKVCNTTISNSDLHFWREVLIFKAKSNRNSRNFSF